MHNSREKRKKKQNKKGSISLRASSIGQVYGVVVVSISRM